MYHLLIERVSTVTSGFVQCQLEFGSSLTWRVSSELSDGLAYLHPYTIHSHGVGWDHIGSTPYECVL
jgi:hypothetical protein